MEDVAYDYEPIAYDVRRIDFLTVRDFIVRHHYAHGMTNNTAAAFGLFDGGHMIGALSFSTPCSEAVRASVFGQGLKDHITELSRLVILDVTPTNTESYFIARCLRMLKEAKEHIWGVVSFADPSAGHVGTIYQAGNARYYGQSTPERFFLDQAGRLRHRRQCGHNVSPQEAIERGWQPVKRAGKHRYCFLLPDSRAHRRRLLDLCQLPEAPYPKHGVTKNGRPGESA